MAEATTDPVPQSRFYCYKCAQRVPRLLDDFTCPICKGGFIEEVSDAPSGPTESGNSSESTFDVGGGGLDFLQLLRGLSDPTGSGGGGASVRFQTGSSPANFQRTRSEGAPSPGSNNPGFSFVIGPHGRGGTGRSNPNLEYPMEHVLFSFLTDLVQGLGGGAAVGGGGLPLLSNVGDYAWGSDGLDAVVTQLMNQMEGTGPPPLATDRIDNLPDVTISQEQVDRKMQCSVCWDDFSVGDVCKKLECDHLYHPDCIIPWLKLHGTCPICRKDLTGQVQEGTKDAPSARFEPMMVDDPSINSSETSSNTGINRNMGSNDRINTAPSSGRNYSSSTTGSNPLVQSISHILDPILSGLAARSPNSNPNSTSNSQPNSARSGSGSGSQQQPPQPDDRRGGQGQGFDNMDLEFD